jgi:dTMP kinase
VRDNDTPCHRGRLISIEGLSGVGKTHLTKRLLAQHPDDGQLVLLEEFSQRTQSDRSDLGRDLLRALKAAANGDHFLRSGHPGTETLLLLAIKMFDYEAGCAAVLAQGRTVIEGRSAHSIAVYQSLIACADEAAAYEYAKVILDLAASWRPLPDLTILITDDVTTALNRAETRDSIRYTDEQRRLHHRAAALFTRLAADDPHRVTVLDRRRLIADALIDHMADLIGAAPIGCLSEPAGRPTAFTSCDQRCRLQQAPGESAPALTPPPRPMGAQP